MHRLHLLAPIVTLSLSLSLGCEDQAAIRAQKAREQALEERLARVEATASELAGRVKMLETQQQQALTALARANEPAPAAIAAELVADGVRIEGGETVDMARLEALLRERVAKQADIALTLKADVAVEYARVIAVIDLAKQVGVKKVAMATEKQP